MKRRQVVGLILGFVLFAWGLFAAGIPQLINYQGFLSDHDGAPLAGSQSIEFLLYSVATEGAAVWSETQNVMVTEGQFSVLLGSVTPIPAVIFASPETYLTLRIGSDTEMSPRQRLASTGYAFQANNADSLNGHGADAFVQKGEGNSVDEGMIIPNIISSINSVSNDGGNVDLVAGSNITITPDDAANTITISASGGSSGDNLGNHTATQNIKLNGYWLSNDGGDEGILVSNMGNVGIGGASSGYRLQVYGSVLSSSSIYAEGNFGSNTGYIRAGTPSSSYGAGDIVATEDLIADGQVISGGLMSCGGNMAIRNHLGVNFGGYSTSYALQVSGDTYSTEDIIAGDKLISGGHCGINFGGTSTTYALRVSGNAYATGTWTSSDLKFKKDIAPLKEPSRKLMDLRGVQYHWRKEEFPGFEFDDSQQYGLIAQEVEKVFPELVKTDENGDKAVNYIGLIPIMLETIKDQQRRIEQLEVRVNP